MSSSISGPKNPEIPSSPVVQKHSHKIGSHRSGQKEEKTSEVSAQFFSKSKNASRDTIYDGKPVTVESQSRGTVYIASEKELTPFREATAQQQAFQDFDNLLSQLKNDSTKKLVEIDDTIEVQDKSAKIIHKALNSFLSGRKKSTQNALQHIFEKISTVLSENPGYRFIDNNGKERSLQKMAQEFLGTPYAKSIIKHSPVVAKLVANLQMSLLTQNKINKSIPMIQENALSFEKLQSKYDKLMEMRTTDTGALANWIQDAKKFLGKF